MESCKNLITHLSRIEGQVRALKTLLESADYHCDQVVQLSLAADSSFSSFKSKLLEEFINVELLKGIEMPSEKAKQFKQMLKLSKN